MKVFFKYAHACIRVVDKEDMLLLALHDKFSQ